MTPEERKKKIIFFSIPHSNDDSILKRFLDQENNDPKKPILSLENMKWEVNKEIKKSQYPYGLGKEWLF